MKPKVEPVLQMCIEDGIARGWSRAHKHTEAPKPEHIQEHIQRAIWELVNEWFDVRRAHDDLA